MNEMVQSGAYELTLTFQAIPSGQPAETREGGRWIHRVRSVVTNRQSKLQGRQLEIQLALTCIMEIFDLSGVPWLASSKPSRGSGSYIGFSSYLVLQMTLEFENPSTISEGGVFRGRRSITELVGIFPTTETVDRIGLEKGGLFRFVEKNSGKPDTDDFLSDAERGIVLTTRKGFPVALLCTQVVIVAGLISLARHSSGEKVNLLIEARMPSSRVISGNSRDFVQLGVDIRGLGQMKFPVIARCPSGVVRAKIGSSAARVRWLQ